MPMTLISCRARSRTRVESTTNDVWTTVSTWVARTIRLKMEYVWSARTNSARSKGTDGGRRPRPRTTSVSGSASNAWTV